MQQAGTVHSIEGLAGLRDRPRSGRGPRLTPEQEAELATAVERGPDPDRDGVVRWRRVDLRALIEARFAVRLHERSVGKVLRRLGFTRLSVQAEAPEGGRGGAGGVQKSFAELVRESAARARPRQAGRGLVPRRGPRRPAGHPDPGVGAARHPAPGAAGPSLRLGLPVRRGLPGAGHRRRPGPAYADTEATGLHLAEIGRHVAPGAHGVVVLDGAGWHAAGDLAVPENLTLLPLPCYAPELNPVENVWEYLRQNKLGHARLGGVRRDRRDLLRGLELARGGARPSRLDHPPRVGQSGQQLRPLVLLGGRTVARWAERPL